MEKKMKRPSQIDRIDAVDITFFAPDDLETPIEPLKPVRVSMASRRIAETEATPMIVHVDNDNNVEEITQTAPEELSEEPAADELVFDADFFDIIAYNLDRDEVAAVERDVEDEGVLVVLPHGGRRRS